MAQASAAGPKGAERDVRGRLLAAGAGLCCEHGLDAFSLREVAGRAGVNQAMVRYYFKDKEGFEAALLDAGFDDFLAALPARAGFRETARAAIAALNRAPWLPLLVARTVYLSADLRTRFLERHAPRLAAALGGRFRLRADIEPRFVVLSIISMLVFPQLARPVAGPILGVQYNDQFAEDFAGHLAKLFLGEGEGR